MLSNISKNNREYLGAIGEKLVAKLENAIISEDKFDSKKDMIDSNGKYIEVKTQNRNKYNNSFSVDASKLINLNKCLTVDRLIFVEYDDSDIIKIWECVHNKNSAFSYKTFNKIMYGWPIDKMILLHSINNAKLAKIMRLKSNSKEFKNNI